MPEGVPIGLSTIMKEIKSPGDIPSGWRGKQLYAIQFFESKSIYHEGDERSKTHPGHGYPAYTEKFTSTRLFITNEEKCWKTMIESVYKDGPRTDVLVFVFTPVNVRTNIQVEFDV